METVLFELGGTPITILEALVAGLGLTVLLLVVLLIAQTRAARRREDENFADAARAAEMERHMADMMRVQSEMTGRMQTMSEIFGNRTSDLAKVLTDRIDASSHRVNQSMTETRTKTDETLTKLNERLAVIDRAQTNITQLSGEIVSLQSILSNKQQRGAFGQGRMEAIIADGLASNGYSFQATLSNNSRPDALIHMPNDAPSLVIRSERLAVIDRAQTNITQLSGEIVSLQSILSNKQQRGAFGQGRMEAIIADGLASNGYSFQATLSNNSRPDALIHMPNDAPSLVI